MNFIPRCFAAWLLCLASAAAIAAPNESDYAQGIRIDPLSDRPLIQMLLPDAVYQTVTRADLGDLRIFNADGLPVAHAFCAAPQTQAPVVTRESLPVSELQVARDSDGDGTKVEVQTADGTHVRVQEAEPASAADGTQTHAPKTYAHIMDARAVPEELRAIQFDWQSPDGASEARIRIEASEDLDQWQTVVGASTLLRVKQGSQQLRRQTIPLPQRKYQYLRATRVDGGPPLLITSVSAERVATPHAIEPQWFTANAVTPADAGILLFDTARLAPVSYARLLLSQENSSVRFSLSSRDSDKSPWHERWSGEAYSIVADGDRRSSAPAEFGATSDRYWRAQFSDRAISLAQPPRLELGYRPARLRFLAQGPGPYTLAYGSRRTDIVPVEQCGNLLQGVGAKELGALIGEASLQSAQVLGGPGALKPLPKQTPVRLFVLWGVLILGVALLVAMAMSLLKRVNPG